MNTKIAMMLTVGAVMANAANATVVIGYDDPEILSPCNDLPVLIEWVSSDGDRPGVLSWIDPDTANVTVDLFDTQTAMPGDTVSPNRNYAFNERIDFMYTVGGNNGTDSYRTDVQADWSQFVVVQEDPETYLVYVEDTRLPLGDDDLDDAVFRVKFCEVTVPAPGAVAVFGMGLAMTGARRRR